MMPYHLNTSAKLQNPYFKTTIVLQKKMFYPSTSDIISICAQEPSDKPRLSFKITVQLVPYLGDKNSDTRHTDSGDSAAENGSCLAAAQQQFENNDSRCDTVKRLQRKET